MTNDDYEYRGLMAQTWDLFRGDTSNWEDRHFYFDVVKEYGQPVLDVGCGTGRLLLDFLAQGIDAEGVDNSPEMLALLRDKAARAMLQPRVHRQSMETLSLSGRYQVILVPSSSFQLVTDPALARQAIARFHFHLLPGGVLAMPFMRLWKEGDPLVNDWPVREQVRQEDGAIFRRWSRSVYDPAAQCESTEDRYEVTLNGHVVSAEHHRRSPATRSYTQAQARQLYADAGFVNVQSYSGFTWTPAKEEDPVFTLIGVRP